jgi:hypothetical protein
MKKILCFALMSGFFAVGPVRALNDVSNIPTAVTKKLPPDPCNPPSVNPNK